MESVGVEVVLLSGGVGGGRPEEEGGGCVVEGCEGVDGEEEAEVAAPAA